MEKEPPIGLRPKYIADFQRIEEIMAAILRYYKEHEKVPTEWIDELGNIVC
jgi:hypothetical protein